MKKFLAFFIAFVLQLLIFNFELLTAVDAHVAGQPPFFMINGKLSGYYHVPLTTDKLQLPLDSSPVLFQVNQIVSFWIEHTLLPINQAQLKDIEFRWDFGDGSKGTGIAKSHTYTKPGSYILTIHMKEPSQEPRLIQSTLLEVVSSQDYELPTASISVNGQEIKDPLTDVVHVDFAKKVTLSAGLSAPGSSTLKSYQWVLNNEEVKTEEEIIYEFDKNKQLAFVILRVTNNDGFIHDAWVQLTNTAFADPMDTQSNFGSPIANFFKQAGDLSTRLTKEGFNFTSNPLLFILAVIAIFIAGSLHAITPGHGKSLMGVYLLGKRKGKFSDVLLITSSITATHTIAIFVLGFIFLALEQTMSVNDIIPYFEKISALVVAFLAVNLIRNGYRNWQHLKAHEHGHDHYHDHKHVQVQSKKDLLLVGVSGGILPCIDAFAILALSVGAGKIVSGIFLVFVFSLGLASTITLLGYLLIHGKDKLKLEERFGKTAEVYGPIASGVLIFLIAVRLLLR